MIKVGDEIEIIKSYIDKQNIGKRFYVVRLDEHLFWYGKERDKNILQQELFVGFYGGDFCRIVSRYMPNRKKLADFIKVNNIKMTLVSLTVGKARNWLHVMVGEKRRGDLSDEALQAILKLIHIDWSKDQVINVKATKEHTAYKTRTSSYKTDQHKDRLQQAMWNGEFVR